MNDRRPTLYPLADRTGVYVKAPPRLAPWLPADAEPPSPPEPDPKCEIRQLCNEATGRSYGAVHTRSPNTGLTTYGYPRTGDPHQDAFQEVLTLATVPLDHELLDLEPPEPDPALEREIERLAAEDRELWRSKRKRR